MGTVQFDDIYLNRSRQAGKVRFAESGLGWKASVPPTANGASTEPFLLPNSEVVSAIWCRGGRGNECRVHTKNKGVIVLDGFEPEDFDALKSVLKNNFNVNLETKEHSVRGWNWGKTDFGRNELSFSVSGKPAFEIPYSEISNSNLVGRNEVAVEFNLQSAQEKSRAGDELVEMRFFVPGTVSNSEEKKRIKSDENGIVQGESSQNGDEEDEEEMAAASVFYDTLKDRADIGQVAGQTLVSFSEVLFLTPRGRFDMDLYPTSMRLRGKTYDYKIQYSAIQRLFLLPKPDELHNLLVIQLDPPLRQGQTRYPLLVSQFLREEELEVELNVEDDVFEEKYAGKLKKKYDQAAHEVVAQVLRGLSGKKITLPSSFTSRHGQCGVNCSLKANEGNLFFLDKGFVFIPKPPLYIPMSQISHVMVSRVGGGGVSSSRTFDLTIVLRQGAGEHQFSNINREELSSIESFMKSKSISVRNELVEEQKKLAAVLGSDSEGEADLDDGDRGSADDDEESVDEDFRADSDSDVAEEYDENAPESSSGEESDQQMEEDDEEEDEEEDDDDGEEGKIVDKPSEGPAKKKIRK